MHDAPNLEQQSLTTAALVLKKYGMSLEEMPLPPSNSKCAETYQALAATHALDGEGKISHYGLSLADAPLDVEMAETAAECATLGVLTYALPVLTYSSGFFGKKTK